MAYGQIRVWVCGFLTLILDMRMEDVIFQRTGIVKDIRGSIKSQGDRGLFYLFLFYFYFMYIKYSLLRYKKSDGSLATAKTKPTELTTHTHVMTSWKPAKFRKTQERPSPIQHLRRKQDEAIPSSRHITKDIIEVKPKQDQTLRRGPKTNQKNLMPPSAEREERIKLLLLNLKMKNNSKRQTRRLQGQVLSQQGKSHRAAALWTLAWAQEVVLYHDTA